MHCCGRRRTPRGGARDSRRVRAEAGLTTLEWLLVVAAVAGLAALAVVLVQNVVGGTAEQIDSSDARQTAADLAVTSLAERWRAAVPTDAAQANKTRWAQPATQAAYQQDRPMAERSIAWLTRNKARRVPYRGVAANHLWLTTRAAAVNLVRLANLGVTHNNGAFTL